MRTCLLTTAALPCTGCAISRSLAIVGDAALFAPGIVSTEFSDVRLTISPDARIALWFSRNRPGGPGGYDIWMSRRTPDGWSAAQPVSFNSPARDFDPAFSADGRHVYFCSDRAGGTGGDDLYRVEVLAQGFGAPEQLGPEVNTPGNEWAPMLSADGTVLLFSSDGRAGAGRMDLHTARRRAAGFSAATPLPGDINTAADEFDATFLADGTTVVFSRAADLRVDAVYLYFAPRSGHLYGAGMVLPDSVNVPGKSTYGPMLDWSRRDHFTFSGQRPEANLGGADVYLIRYRLK